MEKAEHKAFEEERKSKELAEMYSQLKKKTETKITRSRRMAKVLIDVPMINRKDMNDPTSKGMIEIGLVAFSKGYLSKYPSVAVAVKSLEIPTVSHKEVEEEATLMMSLARPALTHVFGVCIDRKPFFIVMQFHGLVKENHYITSTLRRLLHPEAPKEIITSDV